jgi:hypothetical protein
VFGDGSSDDGGVLPSEEPLMNAMMDYWISFIITGDPNPPKTPSTFANSIPLAHWPPHRALPSALHQYLQFTGTGSYEERSNTSGSNVSVAFVSSGNASNSKCALWDRFYESRANVGTTSTVSSISASVGLTTSLATITSTIPMLANPAETATIRDVESLAVKGVDACGRSLLIMLLCVMVMWF